MPKPNLNSNPFTLGVASSPMAENGVVLWTRLAPDPLSGGGMGTAGDIDVKVEVATDPRFSTIVYNGLARAEKTYAHSIHHVVSDLTPNTQYWYRFTYQTYQIVGRTKTAGARESVKFAFTNCQNLQEGLYPVD